MTFENLSHVLALRLWALYACMVWPFPGCVGVGVGGGGFVGYVQGRGLDGCASPSGVYPDGRLQWCFTCGFDFRHGLWLSFVATFAILKELLMVPVWTMSLFWIEDGPFWAVGGGILQWHFTCGFDFRHGLWLPFVAAFAVLRGLLMVPVGTMGPFWPGDSPFRALCMCMRGSLWAVSKIESSVRAPRLLRFILLGSWRR